MSSTGIFVLISVLQFGIIVFLYRSLRAAREETKYEWLQKRQAELRVAMPLDMDSHTC